jgi:hypothetical protein
MLRLNENGWQPLTSIPGPFNDAVLGRGGVLAGMMGVTDGCGGTIGKVK